MSDFVDSPMNSEFTPQGKIPSGPSRNVMNGEDVAPFSEYKRTGSPNAVAEVTYDKSIVGGKPSGEPDHFD